MNRLTLVATLAGLSLGCPAPSQSVGDLGSSDSTAGPGETDPSASSVAGSGSEAGWVSTTTFFPGTDADGSATESIEDPELCDGLVVEDGEGIPAECFDPYVWAWNGTQCQQICACVGPHCDLVDLDQPSCLEPRLQCPSVVEYCPAEDGSVAMNGQFRALTTGAIRTNVVGTSLLFTPDVLALAEWTHSLYAEYEPAGTDGIAVQLGTIDAPGEYPIEATSLVHDMGELWVGTMTVTEVSMSGELADWTMSGAVSVSRKGKDGATETIEGTFTDVTGCGLPPG